MLVTARILNVINGRFSYKQNTSGEEMFSIWQQALNTFFTHDLCDIFVLACLLCYVRPYFSKSYNDTRNNAQDNNCYFALLIFLPKLFRNEYFVS